MQAYISAEGLAFGAASATFYEAPLEVVVFVDIGFSDRNAWCGKEARGELENLTGVFHANRESAVEEQFLNRQVDIWEKSIVVLNKVNSGRRTSEHAGQRVAPQWGVFRTTLSAICPLP